MAAALLTTPLLGFQLRGAVPRHRVAAASVKMQQLATEGDLELPVPATFLDSHKHNLKDLDEYKAMYKRSVDDPSGFWADIANTFHWETPFKETVTTNFDSAAGDVESKWFDGGKTNICYNALDRHVKAGHGEQVCFHHEGNEESDELQDWTYQQTLDEVRVRVRVRVRVS
jgi:acetyl-CoA synthetase